MTPPASTFPRLGELILRRHQSPRVCWDAQPETVPLADAGDDDDHDHDDDDDDDDDCSDDAKQKKSPIILNRTVDLYV